MIAAIDFRAPALAAVALALAGCALNPSPQQFAAADPGPFPDNYQQIVVADFAQTLFDPYSAVFQIGAPSKGWARWLDKVTYGWAVCGTVNAKNRLGGYVGAQPFFVLIRDNQVVRREMGQYIVRDGFCR